MSTKKFFWHSFAAASMFVFAFTESSAAVNAAKIVAGGEMSGSVGFVTYSGTNVLNAQIGRWDTPYPYPDTGQYAPGLQPTGYSIFYIDVDVNDGGVASFRYLMQTYDAGRWDWYDIYMMTPTGTKQIVQRLGKPGDSYGTYWSSPNIAISQSLNQWKNQRVRFVFRVMQDGWGDQTQGQVINFSVNTCDVPPITPLTDPTAISFENGNHVVTDNLTPATRTGLDCMRTRVASLGGSFSLNSAYRPPQYQNHLREVWDTWMALRNRVEVECAELKEEARAEFRRHGLLVTQRPAAGNPNAPHSLGRAFDASISGLPAGQTVDTVASTCQMHRPWPVNDPVHYEPK